MLLGSWQFHLRRSQFLQLFNSSPDERSESFPNCPDSVKSRSDARLLCLITLEVTSALTACTFLVIPQLVLPRGADP
jgi:hypothetical protein